MVKTIALALVSLTAVAAADSDVEDDYYEDDDEPAFNMLGFRLGAGMLPVEGLRTTMFSVGLGVEHPVFDKTRVFGEYEWLWLSRIDERAMQTMSIRPERHASGHRATAGLRRELVAKNMSRSLRLFLDGEIGGGVALVNDNLSGVALVPAGIVGLRVGYDVYSRSDDSPSRTFEAELLVRGIAIEHGLGVLVGIGMLWGN
jgi:hypothetical protein